MWICVEFLRGGGEGGNKSRERNKSFERMIGLLSLQNKVLERAEERSSTRFN